MDRPSHYIEYEELKQKINSITNPQHRNFIKLMYACCARIGEVVRNNPSCKANQPIAGHQIKALPQHMVVEVLTEKVNTLRRVPVSRVLEPWLTEPLITLSKYNQGHLFPFSTRWGQKIFLKWFNTERTHLLRKWRATHLLQGKCTRKRLTEAQVMKIGGWTDTRALHKHYSGVIIEDYMESV